MRRFVAFSIITLLLLYFSSNGLRVEEDLIRSLVSSNPVQEMLFDNFQKNSVFRDKVFIDAKTISGAEEDEISRFLNERKYHRKAVDQKKISSNLFKLAGFLPKSEASLKLTPENADKTAKELLKLATMPGSTTYFDYLQKDPARVLSDGFKKMFPQSSTEKISIYERDGPLVYDEVGIIYDYLKTKSDKIKFISGDFFAYENYLAIKNDIQFCVTLSIPLTLFAFFVFCRRWVLLLFLFAGSIVSYATGLALVRLFYTDVFTIVFAFTSTFVGYNNEYLVHLSGLDKARIKQIGIGLGSAIGTTLIGFLVLLGGDSIIIKQIALISIGAMVGFVGFLFAYQDVLSGIKFKTYTLPYVRIGKTALFSIWLLVLATFAVLPSFNFKTDISNFKYSSSFLDTQADYFTEKLRRYNMSNVFAFEADNGLMDLFHREKALSPKALGSHPLTLFAAEELQAESAQHLHLKYTNFSKELQSKLKKSGIEMRFDFSWIDEIKTLDEFSYLETIGEFSPVPFVHETGGKRFVYLPTDHSDNKASPYNMNPRHYYNALLTDVETRMAVLFLIAFALMVLYLLPIQRRLLKLAYIFAPLGVAAALFFTYISTTGQDVNIVHIMGFSLVIALALDYSSIAVSSGFSSHEMNKILLTGVSTLVGFGIMCFASHPFLADLGITVTFGTIVSLCFTMFIRMHPKHYA